MKQEDKMSKTKLVPFDIEKAKNGAKVITRDGCSVKRLFYDIEHKSNDYPILAYVREDEKERTLYFTELGQHVKCCKSKYDLFIEEEVEEEDDYNPYKEVVKSIADMAERYSELQTLEELKDFYNNVRVKCQDAFDYEKVCMINLDEKPDDKPKFKVGDFIINEYCMGKVIEITNDAYLLDTGQGIPFSCDNTHLWTIQDAKPGDILATKNGYNILIFKNIKSSSGSGFSSYYNYNNFSDYSDFKEGSWDRDRFIPATKEQCDFLFQKMKEAGYEWDKEKKELKKIEKAKTRRMTNQELSWWLREHPEEHREMTYSDEDNYVSSDISYLKSEANIQVYEKIVIRKNGGEWQEPLIEL